MSENFAEEETDAVLLVDAANAFNSINPKVMLHNIKFICPAMAVKQTAVQHVQLLFQSITIVCARGQRNFICGGYHTGLPNSHAVVRRRHCSPVTNDQVG